jgi:hypothetical protein
MSEMATLRHLIEGMYHTCVESKLLLSGIATQFKAPPKC